MKALIFIAVLIAWLIFDLFIYDQVEGRKDNGREEKERKTEKEGHQSEH